MHGFKIQTKIILKYNMVLKLKTKYLRRTKLALVHKY